MKYKNFELDQFQIDAIRAIDENKSVVVSAATGTGKTLIADYVISQAIEEGKEVIYTSPIKALSNQKFREFKEAYGDKVGLLTGDVAINGDAPILIMTTEIYRNMLLEKQEPFPNLSYVVFDEIHYINDIERGTVWEESIIFSPNHVRFVALSATIPNYRDFAAWISHIKQHDVETVNYMKRAVPLDHYLYDYRLGVTKISDLKDDLKNAPQDVFALTKRRRHRGSNKKPRKLPVPNFSSLIKELHDEGTLPAIYFTFSRKDAMQKAWEMSKKSDYTTPEEKKKILEYVRATIPDSIKDMDSTKLLRQILSKGFGVHHAGILPKMKEIVEHLFGEGLIKVLFATETFAVGINMPAKTVVMNNLKKYDGISVRYLSTKEYFQMAGRAGRRGIDKFGRVIVIVNRNELEMDDLERVTSKDVEPIISRFSISYNTTLNLIKNHSKNERDVILRSNFGYFMKKSRNQNRIDQSYVNYLRILKRMGYVNEVVDESGQKDYTITWKGSFATHIFAHELVLPELYYSGILKKMTHVELVAFLAGLEYDGRPSDKFDSGRVDLMPLLRKLDEDLYIVKRIKKRNLRDVMSIARPWVKGASFEDLLEKCNLAEGDIIRLFRRVVDTLKQLKSAIIETEGDEEALQLIRECMDKVDRDLVSVEL